MKLRQVVNELNLEHLCGGDLDSVEVTGGYTSDLMSDVIAKAKRGDVWITNQKHLNIVAVASLLNLAGVIVAGGLRPDDATIEKAKEENVSLFVSDLPAFEVVGRLYNMGLRTNAG